MGPSPRVLAAALVVFTMGCGTGSTPNSTTTVDLSAAVAQWRDDGGQGRLTALDRDLQRIGPQPRQTTTQRLRPKCQQLAQDTKRLANYGPPPGPAQPDMSQGIRLLTNGSNECLIATNPLTSASQGHIQRLIDHAFATINAAGREFDQAARLLPR